MKMKNWTVAICAALALGLTGFYASGLHEPPTISGYSQTEKSVTIIIAPTSEEIKFVQLPDVPESLNIEQHKRQSNSLVASRGQITIPIKNEPVTGEYSILVFVGDDYVELVRQSQQWLKETFNFDRMGGYTILGRRSLPTNDSQLTVKSPLVFSKTPHAIDYEPLEISMYDEINHATGLLRSMWSKPIQQGPTSQSYSQFLEETFEQKMSRLRTGNFAVMCQGFRDLFIHAASANKHFNIRAIEAYNYSPQLTDLISYGHATAEIYIKSLNKWVLFDPWLAIIVTKNGIPVGAAEISSMSDEGLTVVPLVDQLPRMYQNSDGRIINKLFEPKNVSLNQFKCEDLGCSPGYIDYFKSYSIRDFRIE